MRIARHLSLLVWVAAPASTQSQLGASSIFTHDALTCMSTDDFPIVEVELDSAELRGLRQAQVYFKASHTEEWYYVVMEPGEGPRLQATLPKPLAETDRVDYYLFFLSSSFEPAESRPFSVRVSETGCGSERRVAPSSSVSLVLRATVANQPTIPPGFNPQGIASFVTAAGNTVTVGSAAASGGLSAATVGAIAGGGAAAAAGAVIVAGGDGTSASDAASSDGGQTSPGGSTPTSSGSTSSPTPSPSPSPAPSILDVSGTWDVNDRIAESCFPGSVGQTSRTTMMIQQQGTHLTVTLGGPNFSGNMAGTIDATGRISMNGQFTDEGEMGQVTVEATSTSGSTMTGSYTQFYPDHNCTVRGTFSGSKR